ncbi:MAG: VOC family protein [Desulfovibrionaceae bacterium]|jgi:catechol 2,3-dioxygenase-like lactoylglutathione lyase family enzyme|nr:VOC family protein [Desulfovibrionaceae bacterium]
MPLLRLDHLVLTVASIPRSVDFYARVLGLAAETFGQGRTALRCGSARINLHEAGQEISPHAARPTPGSADLCFLDGGSLDGVLARLAECSVPVELGPVRRTGAAGPMLSVYFRDPDGNLLEIGVPEA